MRFVASLVVAMAAAVVPASAQQSMRQVDLAYLTARADVIVQGRVVQAVYEGHPDYPHVATVRVTLEVERMLRGPEGTRYTFREWLTSPRSSRGKQSYHAGDRLLMFMLAPSRYGLSAPIGREQGRFHIVRDARGRDAVANEFSNAGIFKNVSEKAAEEGLALSGEQNRLARVATGPVPLDQFLGLVETLEKLPRIR